MNSTRTKVVLCEDDQATLSVLTDLLTQTGFEVLQAPTLTDARQHCLYGDPDVLLLDLTLPDGDPNELVVEIRSSTEPTDPFDPNLGIVLMCGMETDRERREGISDGADLAIHKPFTFSEVTYGIKVIVDKRASKEGPHIIRAGEITLNRTTHSVKVGDRNIELTLKEFQTLRVLATEPTRVFSFSELLVEVFGWRSLSHTPQIEAVLKQLRDKLNVADGDYIKPCAGVGARLSAPQKTPA